MRREEKAVEIGICHFSLAGKELETRLISYPCPGAQTGEERIHWTRRENLSLADWTEYGFSHFDAMVFIGATGIATRAIAPFVRDKLRDPAVICMDDQGRFVIPLLSGHVGGANELAGILAGRIGATPVVTTATDRAGAFACDLWARKNGLGILNRGGIQAVSSAILRGSRVSIWSEVAWEQGSCLPGELAEIDQIQTLLKADARGEAKTFLLVFESYAKAKAFADHLNRVGSGKKKVADHGLILYARPYVVGIGCRAGISSASILRQYYDFLQRHGLDPHEILALASVDRKAKEEALLALHRQERLAFYTRSPAELMKAEGIFHHSDFVMQTLGCDNVCERAALVIAREFSPEGTSAGLLIPRETGEKVTFAVARRNVLLRI